MEAKIKIVKTLNLTLDGGEVVSAQFLGKGTFAQAYQAGKDVYVLVRDCFMKESIALFADKIPHVPDIEYLGMLDSGAQVFKMPFYEKLRKKHAEAWSHYRTIMAVREEMILERPRGLQEDLRDTVEKLQGRVPDALVRAFETIIEASLTYEETMLDLGPRNLAVDSDGCLILLDILFQPKVLKQKRQGLARRHASEIGGAGIIL